MSHFSNTDLKHDNGVSPVQQKGLADDDTLDVACTNGDEEEARVLRGCNRRSTERGPIDSLMKKAKETLSKSGCCASDLVWGKITSHPWWPGQIVDPADASKKSMKLLKDDRLLVAYFGDATFAWNEPSKLMPFGPHFPKMEEQGADSEAFCLAVDCALDEVGDRIEYSLSCPCLSGGLYEELKFQHIRNSGVCVESRKREAGDEYSDANAFQPEKLVEYVRSVAICGVADKLDLVIAQAQMLSFYRFKGCYSQLPEFEAVGPLLDYDADVLNAKKRVIDTGDGDQVPELKVVAERDGSSPKRRRGSNEVEHTVEKSEEKSRPTALMLNFTDVESVPSATKLNQLFALYGPLIESKTEVRKTRRRAKVVFENHSDAEAAFTSAGNGKYSIFGDSLMSYRLKYLPLPSKRSSTRVAKRGKESSMRGDDN